MVGGTRFNPMSWAGAEICGDIGLRTREGREARLGRKRKRGLKRVGATQLKSKSWVGARDCRGTEKRTNGAKAALKNERKLGLKRVGDPQFKPKSWVGARDCRGNGLRINKGREAILGKGTGAWTKEGGWPSIKTQVLGWGQGLPRDRIADSRGKGSRIKKGNGSLD